MKAAAAQTGVRETFKCGAPEILQIIHTALEKMEEKVKNTSPVLAAGVRNGLLAYRPNWRTMQLEPVTAAVVCRRCRQESRTLQFPPPQCRLVQRQAPVEGRSRSFTEAEIWQ